jgi:hypothetical protein
MSDPAEIFASRSGNVVRLNQTFSKSLAAADLVEPLASLDDNQPSTLGLEVLRISGRQVLGVRRLGHVAGWVLAEDLTSGTVGDHLRDFAATEILESDTGLGTVLEVLNRSRHAFVRWQGEVVGVIGHEDLQKAPLRMWLFGTITLFDLNMTSAIEALHPADSWSDKISQGRFEKARALQAERHRCGGECRLVDCLQIKDKADILLNDPAHLSVLGFSSRREADRFARGIESLRNHLAHAQQLEPDQLVTAARLATSVDSIIQARGVRQIISHHGAKGSAEQPPSQEAAVLQ